MQIAHVVVVECVEDVRKDLPAEFQVFKHRDCDVDSIVAETDGHRGEV